MFVTSEKKRFIQNKEGYIVGWPLLGTGDFGKYAFAEVTWNHRRECTLITYIRDLTENEMAQLPYRRWFQMFQPQSRAKGGLWALGLCVKSTSTPKAAFPPSNGENVSSV